MKAIRKAANRKSSDRRATGAVSKPTRLLAGLSLLSLLAGLQLATQFFAHTFDYQPVLGAHVAHLYAPWAMIPWAFRWYGQYPQETMLAASLGLVLATLGLAGVVIAKRLLTNIAQGDASLHGSARWADKADIQNAGLLPRDRTWIECMTSAGSASAGVYVGGWEDEHGKFHYLRHNGPEHVLTYAPTRSGKGVGLVVPTLLSWPASAVITDMKGELWALTAGWRKQHANNKVIRFEPASLTGAARWNPLDEIRLGTEHETGDVQNLATLIVDPDGQGLETHWQKTSQALLVGVILHLLYTCKETKRPATLGEVDRMLADPNRDAAELWVEMTQYKHVNGKNHPAVGTAGKDMLDRPPEEGGSVLSTTKSYLALYRDPVVAKSVSASDFRIKDLMNHADPVSLYIVTQPNDKARLRPLVRVLVNMIVRLLADKMSFEHGRPVAHYKHRLLAMLDEFPSLGRLEILQESLAFVAGYGIKCYLICQDLSQLKSKETGYGPDESITSNCHVQNAYPPNRLETAEHLSRLSGQTTIVKEQVTTSGQRTAVMLGQVSRTYHEIQRSLLTPDECLRMPGPRKNAAGEIEAPGDMVIYVAGFPAIYGKQPLYFKDPIFAARAAIEAPRVSDIIEASTASEKTDDIPVLDDVVLEAAT